MPTTKHPFISSASRPLSLRMRPDLVVREQSYQGRRYWVVKDPIALNYFRFEEEEYTLLSLLDGRISLSELRAEFENRFAPQQITAAEVHQFLGMLHRNSLVVSDATRQGTQLLQRKREKQNQQRRAAISNILALRLKGFDPDRILAWLNLRLGWIFSLPVVLLSLVLAASALLLIAVQFDTFQSRLPAFHQFFGPHNWLWLFVVLSGTKILHEFGHGLACKRFGGECHEMGVLFLVLTPCLYCNVSDSWMLPNKWRRAAIGAAGMYIELVLAAICTFLWWFSEPGLLNYLCLNVMFVCSVSTLLFNANPLLRYDGYYILSDVLEIPNLRQKSSTILRRKLGSWILGLPYAHDPFLPHRHQSLFAVYAVAAAIYRWIVALAILWFLNRVFEPYGFQILGQLLACVTLYGLLLHPLWQMFKFFRVPGRVDRVRKIRVLGAATVVAAVLLAIGLVPLPHYVTCSVVVQPRAATTVYVDMPGQIESIFVQPGQVVHDGQPLLTLANVDAEVAIAELESQRARERSRLTSLHQSAVYGDESAALEIAEAEQTLATLDEQLELRRKRLARLRIHSPVSGTIVPPTTRPEPEPDANRLPTWSGTPLQVNNVGAFLEDGTVVCQIGDPSKLNAVLAIDQGDIEFVQAGQQVQVFLDQLPGQQIDAPIDLVSSVRMNSMPLALSSKAGGEVHTRTDSSGHETPTEATFQANVPLPPTPHLLLSGATGTAKIRVGSQSLGRRCWRYLCRTFNFEL